MGIILIAILWLIWLAVMIYLAYPLSKSILVQQKLKDYLTKHSTERVQDMNKNCFNCDKKLEPHLESVIFGTDDWDGHSFRCECMPKGWVISVG